MRVRPMLGAGYRVEIRPLRIGDGSTSTVSSADSVFSAAQKYDEVSKGADLAQKAVQSLSTRFDDLASYLLGVDQASTLLKSAASAFDDAEKEKKAAFEQYRTSTEKDS